MGAEVGKGPQFYTQSWSFSKVEGKSSGRNQDWNIYRTKLLGCIRLNNCQILYTFVNKIALKGPKSSTKASPLYRGTG